MAFFYRTLLVVVAFLLHHQPAGAQGVEVITLTETSKTQITKGPETLPAVMVVDNSASVEQNFNATPISTDPNAPNLIIERLAEQLRENQRRLDEFMRRSTSEQQAARGEILALTKLIDDQKKTLGEAMASVKQKQDELNTLYQAKLDDIRAQVNKNISLFSTALDSYDTQISEITRAQATYWKDEPDIEDKTLQFKASQAQYEFSQLLTVLRQEQQEARASYEKFREEQTRLKDYKFDAAGPDKTAYNGLLGDAQKASTDTQTKVDKVKNGLLAYNKAVTDKEVAFKIQRDKKASSADNLTALPGLTSIKGTGLFIPALTLLGSHRQGEDDSPNIYSVKLFTALGGGSKASDIPSERGTERLFIPDASTFGFSADAAFTFDYGLDGKSGSEKRKSVVGVVFGVSYLDKLMTPDSSTTFTTGVVTARVSLEWFLVPNVLMIYGGANSLTFLTGQDQMREHYTITRPKDVYGFTNAGARAILKPGKSDVSFLFDLGFIIKGDNVRKFVPNGDTVITTIRATVAKNFALR